MSAHPPPTPPANRSPKGPGEPATARDTQRGNEARPSKAPNNADQQGQSGASKQNTTHPGYQQDR